MSDERVPEPTEFEPVSPADEFDRRWRAAANADPGHATYPEAVPGHRRPAGTRGRGFDLDRVCVDEAWVGSLPPEAPPEAYVRADRDTGGMIVQWLPSELWDAATVKPRRWYDPRTWWRR